MALELGALDLVDEGVLALVPVGVCVGVGVGVGVFEAERVVVGVTEDVPVELALALPDDVSDRVERAVIEEDALAALLDVRDSDPVGLLVSVTCAVRVGVASALTVPLLL